MHPGDGVQAIPNVQRKSALAMLFRFTKIEHTAFSLPLVIAGCWIGAEGRLPSLAVLLLVVVAAAGARIFGMSFNRIFDRALDARNPRTASRELPSGQMSVRMSLVVAFAGLAVYLAACTVLGGWCLILSPVPLIPLLGYSLLKRYTMFCHFGIGLCLALAPIGAYVAATNDIRFSTSILLFGVFVFFWLSGADIIYALLDIQSDLAEGIHSLPAALGPVKALGISAACETAALAALSAVYFLMQGGGASAAALLVSAAAMLAMYLPGIPVPMRFFPISTAAGIAASFVPILSRLP
jgi:4-hydroxybenzoate polyprenyltransferase